MASVLKVDKLDPQSGTALEIGTSGDTITVPSGATFAVSGTMNASSITAGTVATARLGSGTASSSTILYGDQTYKTEPSGVALATSTNNQVVTVTGADAITGESGLIFDGSDLGVGCTPSAKFEVEDGGTGTGNVLAKFTLDDQSSHYGISVGNDTFSTTDADGLMLMQKNDGTGEILNAGELVFSIDSTGAVTKPLTPAFSVLSTSTANVTGDGTNYEITNSANWGSEAFDQGGDLAGTGIFTAPVDGRYQLSVGWQFGGITSSHTRCTLTIATSNRSYYLYFDPYSYCEKSGNTITVNGSWLADMDASDTAFLKLRVFNGTLVVDMSDETMWQGFLAC